MQPYCISLHALQLVSHLILIHIEYYMVNVISARVSARATGISPNPEWIPCKVCLSSRLVTSALICETGNIANACSTWQ